MVNVIHCFIVHNSCVDTYALRERGFNVDLSASESIPAGIHIRQDSLINQV